MWQCCKIKDFWEEIKKIIEKIISKDLLKNPAFFILGPYPKGHKYTQSERIIIDMCLLHAKKSIALFWKKKKKNKSAKCYILDYADVGSLSSGKKKSHIC